jgi:magnesium transporter
LKPLSDIEKWKLLASKDADQAASDISEKSLAETGRLSEELGVAYLAEVVSQLGTDVAAGMLQSLPRDFREQVLAALTPEKRTALLEILSYELDTAGSLMAKEFLSIPLDATLGETTRYLQTIPREKRGKVSYIYVVDKNQRLEGVIQVRDLVFHPPETPVRAILKSPVVQVETDMSQLDVARLLQRHRYLGLPVVDGQQRLVGVINADSAMRVLEQEAIDDIATIVGTSAEEIRADSVSRILCLRLPWLMVNLVSGLLCAFISGFFQNDLASVATLFLFVPVVLGLSESTGVQGATMVVRNLALGQTSWGRMMALFVKEALAGITIGVICGGVVGAVATLWHGHPEVGIALSVSMTVAIAISAFIGLLLPFIFKRFHIEPAIASGPLVLALCDLQALIVYFSLSSLLLKVL